MEDFLLYRTMITPMLITVVSYILMGVTLLGGLGLLVAGENDSARLGRLLVALLGPLYIRILAEVIIVLFRINNTLTEIKNLND